MAKRKNKKLGRLIIPILAVITAAGLYALSHFGVLDKLLGSDSYAPAKGELDIHFIDVGQGDCSLIVSGDKAILIDCGEKENGEKICRYLDSHNIPDIDIFLMTHPHADHIGAASYIIDNFDVKRIIAPKIPDDLVPTSKVYRKMLKSVQDKNLKLTQAKPGDEYDAGGGAVLKIISPVSDDYDELNDFSAAAVLRHGEHRFMFTGDLEKRSEKDVLDAGYLTPVDVLKVAHHGSSGSSSKDFLKAVQPKEAVIMCDGKSYGHPSQKALDRISEYTDKIYRTDLNGTIVVKSFPDRIETETEK